jgi:hypothetical protein
MEEDNIILAGICLETSKLAKKKLDDSADSFYKGLKGIIDSLMLSPEATFFSAMELYNFQLKPLLDYII